MVDNSRNKWKKYSAFSNKGYFVVPKYLMKQKVGSVMIEAVKDQGWGILILEDNGRLKSVVRAKFRNMKPSFKRQIISRLAWRGGISTANTVPTSVYLDPPLNNTKIKTKKNHEDNPSF